MEWDRRTLILFSSRAGPFRYGLSQNLTPSPVSHWRDCRTLDYIVAYVTRVVCVTSVRVSVRLPVDLIDDGRVPIVPRRRCRRPVIGFSVVRRHSPTGRARAQAQQQHGYLKRKQKTRAIRRRPRPRHGTRRGIRLSINFTQWPCARSGLPCVAAAAEVDNPAARKGPRGTFRVSSFRYYSTDTRPIVGLGWRRRNALTV